MRICAWCLSCFLLVACGIKGPLYIPERQYPQDQTPEQLKHSPQKQPADAAQQK